MGLDTFSTNKELDYSDIELCGGMFSGNGNEGSFRGKVYDNFIEEVTGVTLYQEKMSKEDLSTIVSRLNSWLQTNVDNQLEGADEDSIQEWTDAYNLHKWFKVTLDGGATVEGWW